MDTKKLEADFVKLIEADTEGALSLITGMFVGLTVEYLKRRGVDVSKEITIDGGHRRNITLHAPKNKATQP